MLKYCDYSHLSLTDIEQHNPNYLSRYANACRFITAPRTNGHCLKHSHWQRSPSGHYFFVLHFHIISWLTVRAMPLRETQPGWVSWDQSLQLRRINHRSEKHFSAEGIFLLYAITLEDTDAIHTKHLDAFLRFVFRMVRYWSFGVHIVLSYFKYTETPLRVPKCRYAKANLDDMYSSTTRNLMKSKEKQKSN